MLDRKEFRLGALESSRKIFIEERNERKHGRLELDVGTSMWARDCLKVEDEASFFVGFWRRRMLEFTIIFF